MLSKIERRCETEEYVYITPATEPMFNECCKLLAHEGIGYNIHKENDLAGWEQGDAISVNPIEDVYTLDKVEALLAIHGKVVTKHKHARLVEAHYVDGEGRKPWERGHVNT
tara:strand:- start:85 stop:417 length:333 start_codon:yes stop_codon:yes gene_type:complete